MKHIERIFLGTIIIFIIFLSIFLGTRKTGYHVDEVWTFGLANNVGDIVPSLEYGKVYVADELYKDFVQVDSDHRFDYVNVWNNQSKDVHPPFYYILVHTICSIFPNTYNMWYGLAINLFWSVGILMLLYKLAKAITSNNIISLAIILIYGTTVAYFDTMLLIRMYAQFTFFTIALSYLFKKYWDRTLDKKFYVLLSAIAILGLFTHYYFLIYMFFISVAFAIHLFLEKKYIELKKCIFVALGDGLLYILAWYHILSHLFRGYRGKQAISAAFSFDDVFKKIIGIFHILNLEAFFGLLPLFMIITILLCFTYIKKRGAKYNFEVAMFLSGFFFVLVVGKVAPLTTARYIMPIVFISIIVAYLALNNFLAFWINKKASVYLTTIVFLVINFLNLYSRSFYVPNDYNSDTESALEKYLEDKECTIYINDTWECLYYFKQAQHAKSYTFVNPDTVDLLSSLGEGDILAADNSYSEIISKYVSADTVFESGDITFYEVNEVK